MCHAGLSGACWPCQLILVPRMSHGCSDLALCFCLWVQLLILVETVFCVTFQDLLEDT